MEISIAIVSFLFHCFTAFALIYACDKENIWGDIGDKKTEIQMPKIRDIEDEIEDKKDSYLFKDFLQDFVDKKICPATKYFTLLNEIKNYQYDKGGTPEIIPSSILQIFTIGLSSIMLVKAEVIESLILSVICVTIVCSVFSFIIYWVYKHYWRCRKLRAKHFTYDEYFYKDLFESTAEIDKSRKRALINYFISDHYEYLYTIKDNVIFRYFTKKVLFSLSWIIYFLFFFTIPD